MGVPSTTPHTPSSGCVALLQADTTARAAANTNHSRPRIFNDVSSGIPMRKRAELGCFRDAAGPNAGSADANVHAHAFDHGADALKIWIPAAAAGIVRVADHVAERRSLAANLAFHCHDNSSPISYEVKQRNQFSRVLADSHAI